MGLFTENGIGLNNHMAFVNCCALALQLHLNIVRQTGRAFGSEPDALPIFSSVRCTDSLLTKIGHLVIGV